MKRTGSIMSSEHEAHLDSRYVCLQSYTVFLKSQALFLPTCSCILRRWVWETKADVTSHALWVQPLQILKAEKCEKGGSETSAAVLPLSRAVCAPGCMLSTQIFGRVRRPRRKPTWCSDTSRDEGKCPHLGPTEDLHVLALTRELFGDEDLCVHLV